MSGAAAGDSVEGRGRLDPSSSGRAIANDVAVEMRAEGLLP
jgi:hypothetical protein